MRQRQLILHVISWQNVIATSDREVFSPALRVQYKVTKHREQEQQQQDNALQGSCDCDVGGNDVGGNDVANLLLSIPTVPTKFSLWRRMKDAPIRHTFTCARISAKDNEI